MSNEIIVSLISSIVGGLLVAIVNYFFTRRKTEAETLKLKEEAEKLKAEAEKTRVEVRNLNATVKYHMPPTEEKIIYDSASGIFGYDFDIKGEHSFKDGALIIEQLGKFSVCLQKYIVDGQEWKYLPKKKHPAQERKFRVSCEARVSRGNFTFALLFRGHNNGAIVGNLAEVDDSKWTTVDWYFEVPPDCDFKLLIEDPIPLIKYLDDILDEDQEVPLPNCKLQIKSLMLAEHAGK